jgi:uncharacterized protein YqeY
MGLKEKLQQDLKSAMRARDARRKSALRMVLTSIQLAEVEQKDALTDEAIIDLIRKEVRRREDALSIMQDAGRDDLVGDEQAELEILKPYLPQLLTEDEIVVIVKGVIAEVGATSPADLGQVMRVLMPRVKGKADGRMVNQTVRNLLSA